MDTLLPPIQYPAPTLRWLIALTVMLITVMEILDMTIVSVALPSMMGELGANSDQITWVITSYIVSSAIVMLMTGFLVGRLGRKRYMLIMIVGFLTASMLCGFSQNLSQIILFRILQGVFGASLVPMSQYILSDTFPPKQMGVAMAIWGMGIMVAPILGPTLGGYITNHLNWRWIFFINLPVCLIAIFMTLHFIAETPRKKSHIDWLGLFLMGLGVACLQIFLDRGNSNNWFHSFSIQLLCMIWVIALATFIIRGIGKKDNIINLSLFKSRNFTLATILLMLFTMGILALISLQPLLLENFMGYTPEQAGLAMMSRGIASIFGMMVVMNTINRIDGRLIIFIGVACAACGTFLMTHLNLQVSPWTFEIDGMIQGFGMGMFFVPISAYSFSDITQAQKAEASGLFSFGRNLGISIGVSVLSTIVSHETQVNWNRLGGHLTHQNIPTQQWLAAAQSAHLSSGQALANLSMHVASQASMIAFLDSYWLVLAGFAIMLPLIWMLKKVEIKNEISH
jgi:DHA2 family multidrug resistance protein